MFFCVPQVGCWPSAMVRRIVSNLSALVPSRGSSALVPACWPPRAGDPMKMRVKFAGTGTMQSCEITSGSRGMQDTSAKISAEGKKKRANFIQLPCQGAMTNQTLVGSVSISLLGYQTPCIPDDDCQKYSSAVNAFE